MANNPPPYSTVDVTHHVITPGVTTVTYNNAVPGAVPIIVGQQMGPNQRMMVCKSCEHEIVTRVERVATMRTHVVALILCLLGCWPCACIPYCMDSCRNAEHYCPKCGAYIGIYTH